MSLFSYWHFILSQKIESRTNLAPDSSVYQCLCIPLLSMFMHCLYFGVVPRLLDWIFQYWQLTNKTDQSQMLIFTRQPTVPCILQLRLTNVYTPSPLLSSSEEILTTPMYLIATSPSLVMLGFCATDHVERIMHFRSKSTLWSCSEVSAGKIPNDSVQEATKNRKHKAL